MLCNYVSEHDLSDGSSLPLQAYSKPLMAKIRAQQVEITRLQQYTADMHGEPLQFDTSEVRLPRTVKLCACWINHKGGPAGIMPVTRTLLSF